MRLLAIGDVHGCSTALETLLEAAAPAPDDRIVALGDYVDRGPNSRGVFDRLIALYDSGLLVPLLGNHDLMFLEAREGHNGGWLSVGGKQTLLSYGIDNDIIDRLGKEEIWQHNPSELLAKVPQRHWQFLDNDCLPYYETDEYIFVHANLYADVPLREQPDYMLYWERLVGPIGHVSGKIVICGHTRQKNGWPLDLGSTICIDTNVYDDGWLTCLDVHSGRVWQANELGKGRKGWLGDVCEPEA